MERFAGLEAFVAVVEDGSFTAAAATLGVSKSYVSKQVSALEDRLGARLMNRTTRSLSLTSAGQAFFDRCSQILVEIENAERAVTQLQTEPRGLLRLSVPLTFGVRWLAPLIADFMSQHAELEVEVDFSDRKVDLVDEGFDLVVRIGVLEDSSFAFKRIAPVRMLCCMTPAYRDAHGPFRQPEDLAPEECLTYAYTAATWHFVKDGAERHIRVRGRLRANNGEALAAACAEGQGVAILPDFIAAPLVQEGKLVTVLDDWIDNERRAVWALYPHSRHLSAKVRQFVEFIAEQLDPCPWNDLLKNG